MTKRGTLVKIISPYRRMCKSGLYLLCDMSGKTSANPFVNHAISRLQGTLRVYTLLRSHWFLVPFSLILICHRTNLDFSFTIKQFSFEC